MPIAPAVENHLARPVPPTTPNATSLIGSTIGPYRVNSLLGQGGMGEVWRARDERLDREVALKVLPTDLAADADRLERFEREARVLASLDHPNIATLHALEEVDGRHVLVMELVEGEDLSARLRRGRLDVEGAVAIATQIAEALAAAHERGIVHRDLKPANIRVRPDGRVKVLDFGLATTWKAEITESDLTQSPTLTQRATAAGVLLGTVGYMSPEQARGQAVDRRADVWAFGVILWEMLTGQRLFDGATVSDVLASLLTTVPDLSGLPPTIPAAVRRVLRGCLERDPSRRLRDAGDLALLLELEEAPPSDGKSFDRPKAGWLAVGLVVLGAALGWAAVRLLGPEPSDGPIHHTLALSLLEQNLDPAHSFAVSPDGRSVAVTLESDGLYQIGIRRLDEFETRPIPDTEGGFSPFYSPDGSELGFLTRTGLEVMGLDGTARQTRADLAGRVRFDPWDAGSNPTAAWLADGRIVLSTGHWRTVSAGPGLLLVSADGSVEPLTTFLVDRTEYQHMNPEVVENGRQVLFTTRSRREPDRIEVVDLESRERRVLLTGGAEGHLVDGRYLVHVRDFYSKVAVSRVDDSLQVIGAPKILYDNVSPYTSTALQITSDGSLLYRRGASGGGNQQILELDRNGAVTPLPIAPADWMQPHISPEGDRLLLRQLGDNCQLWQWDLRRQVLSRITDPADDYHDGIWDRDGRAVLAGLQDESGGRQLVRVELGSRREPLLLGVDSVRGPEAGAATAAATRFPSSVSADGHSVLFTALGRETDLDVWVLDRISSAAESIAATPAIELGGVFSPSGDWIAYASDESGRQEIYLVDWPGLSRRLQVSDLGGSAPFWARDGSSLFYVRGDRIIEVVLEDTEEPRLSQPQEILHHIMGPEGWWMADVYPDGERFVIVSPTVSATEELRLVTDFVSRLDRLFEGE